MISYLKCKKLKFHLLFFYASLSTARLFFQQSLNHFFPCRYESLLKIEDEKLKGILTSRQWLGTQQVSREPSTLRPHVLTQYPDIALQTTSDLKMKTALIIFQIGPAAAAAKSLQSCPTLCDPIDGSPPGSPFPGILQARTLEWVAISFSNAWKWKVKVKSLSHVRLLATPWIAAHQAPPSMGFSRQEYWSGVPLPSTPPQFKRSTRPNQERKTHTTIKEEPPSCYN